MSKKQVMKEIFEEKINKDRIYHNVLLKAEEECNMSKGKNKKLIYFITSGVAVFILGFGIILGTNTLNKYLFNDNSYGIADFNKNKEEALKTELNIYKVASLTSTDMDVKIENYSPKLPEHIWQEILEEFKNEVGISKENFEAKIPNKFILSNFYSSSIRGYKDANLTDEYKIHDYVFEYKTEKNGNVIIAICKEEKPLRDYFFEFKGKKSKIENVELEISQYEDSYIVNFEFNNINYDIETNGIRENELLELLQSIIIENATINKSVEDKDVNLKEQPSENINTDYPDYYAGKYVDSNGQNVVLLCEDNKTNRKEICNLLGITESKTIFKTAKYSYNYLTDLQNKISQKMINKEFTFVTSSAVIEDSNNIKVTITSNNENDLNKLKALDSIGGAIEFEYNTNAQQIEDLLVEKE